MQQPKVVAVPRIFALWAGRLAGRAPGDLARLRRQVAGLARAHVIAACPAFDADRVAAAIAALAAVPPDWLRPLLQDLGPELDGL